MDLVLETYDPDLFAETISMKKNQNHPNTFQYFFMKFKKLVPLFFLYMLIISIYCEDVNEILKHGMLQYKSSNYKKAIDFFTQVLLIDPQNPQAKKYIKKSADKLLVPEKKAVEKEKALFIKEAQAALKEHKKETALRDKKIKPAFKSAKKYYNKKYFLKATDKFKEIILQYTDYEPAKKYYEKIVNDIALISKEVQTSDLERLSYARGYILYYEQKLPDAVNEWCKVLQINPDRDELKDYIGKVREYLKNVEQLAREKETEERVERIFSEGIVNFENKLFVECVKKMENVQNICQNEPFPKSLEWYSKAQEYITKAVDELSKITVKPVKPVVSEKQVEIEAEIDIAGAEKKYNEGLILYAQGKLFDAVQKWEIAVRMNPNHEKVQRALEKARKELKLRRR